MAILKTSGIVLRRQPFRETSLRVMIFTRDFGKAAFLVKGVRKLNSRDLSCFEPLSEIDLVFYAHFQSGMHLISEASPICLRAHWVREIERYGWACYVAELLDTILEIQDPHEGLYEELREALEELDLGQPERAVRLFQVRALRAAGYLPELGRCSECGCEVRGSEGRARVAFSARSGGVLCAAHGARAGAFGMTPGALNVLRHVAARGTQRGGERLQWSSVLAGELGHALDTFVEWRVERQLKSLHFLREVKRYGRPGARSQSAQSM